MRRSLHRVSSAFVLLLLGSSLSACVVAPTRARVWMPGHWAAPHVWVHGHWRYRR